MIQNARDPVSRWPYFGVLLAASLITAGSFYIYSNERLDYVNFEDGEMAHSTLPQLAGPVDAGRLDTRF